MTPLKLAYEDDKMLEIHRDTTDFFIDGIRGNFSSSRCRDFVIEVALRAPKTAMFGELTAILPIKGREVLKKLAYDIRDRLAQANLSVPVLESVHSQGYRLAKGWRRVDAEIGSKHLAFDLLRELDTALDRAREHVNRASIVTNTIGLQFVERSEETVALARNNYTLIEDAGWQLIMVLSSCGIANEDHPDVLEVKKKIEKVISYALFWRIGDNLTEEKWRKDFQSESKKLAADIRALIERILEAASARKKTPR